MVKNLVSIWKFTTDNFVSITFDPFGFTVKDFKTCAFIQRFDSVGDLYPVFPLSSRSPSDNIFVVVILPTWHRPLRHHGSWILQFLHSRYFISSSTNKLFTCHACQLGKHFRLTLSASTTKTSRLFELVHSDLWTSHVTSMSGFKYYALLCSLLGWFFSFFCGCFHFMQNLIFFKCNFQLS